MTSASFPSVFVPHGAPTFILQPGPAGAAMRGFADSLPTPRAIVVVTPHWATAQPTVGSAAQPQTIHDYWGFPAPLYEMRYAAPGAPALAQQVQQLLGSAGFAAELDPQAGLDHGAWMPLQVMFPAADIPVVPLSVQPEAGPLHHYRLGQALAPLRAQGVLLVASGNLTHNLYHYRVASRSAQVPAYVTAFQGWVWQQLQAAAGSGEVSALLDYRSQAPGGVEAHPTDEHLLPLYVALGAAHAEGAPGFAVERLYDGIYEYMLAMDGYAFRGLGEAV